MTRAERGNWKRIFCKCWGHELIVCRDIFYGTDKMDCLRCYSSHSLNSSDAEHIIAAVADRLRDIYSRLAALEGEATRGRAN